MSALVGRRVAAVLGGLVCVALPLASWLVDGRGRLAYNMYASTITYRLEIAAVGRSGDRRAIDPSDVAAEVSSPAAPFLTGADDFRTVAQIDALRAHLADVARASCRIRATFAIEIVLHEHSLPLGAPSFDAERESVRTERVLCASSGSSP